MNDAIIDLHIHSCFSDGSDSIEEIVTKSLDRGLQAISITDHDTFDHFDDIYLYEDLIEIVPALEISVQHTSEMHILAYYVNRCSLLAQTIDSIKQQNIKSYIQNLRRRRKGGDEIAYTKISCERCIRLIHSCGGIAVLAHPIRLGLKYQALDSLLGKLKEYGLDGIEYYHSEQDEPHRREYGALAAKYELLISGGSDYHGVYKKHVALGETLGGVVIPYSVLSAMKHLHLDRLHREKTKL